jgi:competence protein ComEC
VGIALLHSAAEDPIAEFASLKPEGVTVEGRMASPPEPAEFGYKGELSVDHLWYEGEEVLRGGKVQVYAGDLSVGVGDKVRVDGELVRPESDGEFDYARYLTTKNVSALLYAEGVRPVEGEEGWIGEVHSRADTAMSYGLRPEEASIVRSMVLGDRSRMSEELQEDFRRAGVTHILAISGQHVAVLTAVVYLVLRLLALSPVVRNPATLGVVWLYILIAGAPPSAVRAGVVATLVLVAPLAKRQISPLHFMSVMLALVLAYNPFLIYSAGFQLSVTAVFGILLLRKPLKAFVEKVLRRPPRAISELLSISLAAQISTAPIIAATFEMVSLVGPLTNLIAVPLSGPILSLGVAGSFLGNVVPPLAYPVNASNGFLVTVLEWVARGASSLPFAATTTQAVSLPMVALFYLFGLPAATARFTAPERRWPLAGGLLIAWAGVWVIFTSVAGG